MKKSNHSLLIILVSALILAVVIAVVASVFRQYRNPTSDGLNTIYLSDYIKRDISEIEMVSDLSVDCLSSD